MKAQPFRGPFKSSAGRLAAGSLAALAGAALFGCSPSPGAPDMAKGTPDLHAGTHDLQTGAPDLHAGARDLSQESPDLSGGVGAGGGTVDSLFFAIIGDTRPANLDDTANYPTAIIEKIFADIEAMAPRPQFVVGTGDYQFATSTGKMGAPQVALYAQARQKYSGTLFAAMGNHECDGYTADNCTAATNNYDAYNQYLLLPLGKSLPYYSVPITATDKSWTAKLLILACNYWSTTQQSWLSKELSQSPPTYTFVVRHEQATATSGPCVNDVESLLAGNHYSLSIVGHTHQFEVNGKEVVVGNGGAPLANGVYGYATVQQTAKGWVVANYDYSSGGVVSTTTIPF